MARLLRKLPSKFIASQLDGELILIHGDSGAFYSIAETGLVIWRLLDEEAELDTICERLAAIYAVDDSECRAAVERFSNELVQAGFAELA
ncbi:PqqD family protein [Altererythrobacter sp. Z27]|uniref:PqqD family protein n=1 Tax=Altererythrobacter sp. Z27 TaxID=3461147 RepID=UPI004043E4FA